MKKNVVARAIYAANKQKNPIRVNLRLKKNGQFSSIEGVVEDVRVSKDGYPYIIVNPMDDSHMQTVIMNNIRSVHDGDRLHKR